jgi:hypothetical protein
MSMARSELRRPSPSTMLTGSYTYLRIMLLKTRPLISSGPRFVDCICIYLDIAANLSKGWGERVVRSIFPETTIVRPAPMFGFEDRLLHKLAGATNLFTANHMQEKYWPVHVSERALTLYEPCTHWCRRRLMLEPLLSVWCMMTTPRHKPSNYTDLSSTIPLKLPSSWTAKSSSTVATSTCPKLC